MDGSIVFGAKYLIFIAGMLVLVFWYKQKPNQKVELAASLILAAILALVTSKIISKLYYHPRPFVISGIKPLFAHANDSGFPSDHTTGAAALATVVYFYRKDLAYGLAVVAILIGISRMAAHVHSLLDILGGLILGIICGVAGYWLAKKFMTKKASPPVV